MFDNEQKTTAVNAYLKAWAKAEDAVKLSEDINNMLVTSAIGELRYAGRRFADAVKIELRHIENIDGNGVIEAINEARNNCIRAEHDAVDAAAVFLHGRIKQMQDEFGIAICLKSFLDYTEFLKLQEAFALKIRESRRDRHKRTLIYDDLQDYHLPKLKILHDSMVVSEDAIKEHLENESLKQKVQKRWNQTNLIVGIVGLIIGLFSVLFFYI